MNQLLRLFQLTVFIILILIYSVLTYKRNLIWKDDISLWSDVVNKSPEKARSHLELCIFGNKRGLYELAGFECKKVLNLEPHCSMAYLEIGFSLQRRGFLDGALAEYKKALQLRPDYVEAYNNIGVIYKEKGLIDEAITYYEMAVALRPYDPKYITTYNNLIRALRERGLIDKAIAMCETIFGLKPNDANIRNECGVCYIYKGWVAKAIEQFKLAIEIEPANPNFHYNLEKAYSLKGLKEFNFKEMKKRR
jgi:tetratricopeptide (TPR) repeat protein